MKKAIQIIFVVLALVSFTTRAQSTKIGDAVPVNNYANSIGIRLGSENGFTFKHFYKPTWAYEVTLTTGYRALIVTGLVEKHYLVGEGLNLFLGGGAHFGEWGYVAYYRYRYFDGESYYIRKSYRTIPSIGIDGIAGIEWIIPKAPVTLSLDVKPYLDVFYPGDSWIEGAFSIRYILK